jgi:hypothetical protein
MDFENIDRLGEYGFCEPVRIGFLDQTACDQVPSVSGVYCVIRDKKTPPQFLDQNPAGHFKGNNPTTLVSKLQAKWVDKTFLMYVGESENLKRRVLQCIQFGQGQPIGHWGGRYMWQLSDSSDYLFSWKRILDDNPADVKRRLIHTFRTRYGKRPFANLKD